MLPVRNSITNLAIVRAATQIRDTLANASSQMRNKLTPNKTSSAHQISGYKKYSLTGNKYRAVTETSSRLQQLKPTAVSTNLPPSTTGNKDKNSTALTKKGGLGTSLLRRGSIDTAGSIDSSDIEEEKLPPFLGNVESHLKREYN